LTTFRCDFYPHLGILLQLINGSEKILHALGRSADIWCPRYQDILKVGEKLRRGVLSSPKKWRFWELERQRAALCFCVYLTLKVAYKFTETPDRVWFDIWTEKVPALLDNSN
jgi:hypothetical protein